MTMKNRQALVEWNACHWQGFTEKGNNRDNVTVPKHMLDLDPNNVIIIIIIDHYVPSLTIPIQLKSKGDGQKCHSE